MQKHLTALIFVGLGLGLLMVLSDRSLIAEKEYFEKLVLASNRDVSFLAARQAVDEMRLIRQQMDGLARLIIKESFDEQKVQSHLRYHFENHRSIVAMRYRPMDGSFREFRNPGFAFSTSFLDHGNKQWDDWLAQKQDLMLPPYEVRGSMILSRIHFIRDLRANSIPGVIEVQVALDRLFAPAMDLSRQKGGAIVIVSESQGVIVPRMGGHIFSGAEVSEMKASGSGGVRRTQGGAEELVSWCGFQLLEPIHAPDWLVLYVEQDKVIREFMERIQGNLTGLVLLGFICLVLLSRLVIYR